MLSKLEKHWANILPVLAWLLYIGKSFGLQGGYDLFVALGLTGVVLAAVHHAEVIAHRIGEPAGTLVLAIAITIIEVALIVSLMLTGGQETLTLARDTVFAAIMIILTGIIGLCLLAGGVRYKEQQFGRHGTSAALVTLTAISVLTLILPNYTTSLPGPVYSVSQLIFVAIISLVLYGTFVMVQTVTHRSYFLPEDAEQDEMEEDLIKPSKTLTAVSAVFLLVCLAAVVLLAKKLAPVIEQKVTAMGAPESVVGVIVALVILLPEGLAAYRAAKKNQLQISLNLALGSALASIGLTIPAVALVSIMTGMTISLGIDTKSTVLLVLSLFTVALSFTTGRTTIMQGVVLLVLFAVYLFTTVVP